MAAEWDNALRRWVEAGLLDPATAAAIARWEGERPRPAAGRLGAPILVCLVLGAVLLGAGVLLFVAAHWDNLAPGGRFALVLGLLVGLHGAAAAIAPGFAALAVALHAVGSVALGGGIFLVGQVFNLQTHWPAGVLLWAIGAALGWLLLRQWPQLALLALLVPAWLLSEWLWLCLHRVIDPQGNVWALMAIPQAGWLLLCLAYLGAPRGATADPARRVLLWLGGLNLIPAALSWTAQFHGHADHGGEPGLLSSGLPVGLALLGWITALGGPLLLGWFLRGRAFWPLAAAAGWILADIAISNPLTPWSYAWRAIGGILLVVWGLRDSRAERINLGTALVAITVIAFYFAEVMDRFERSLSMIGLGLLCLLGGWGLEWLRRRMISRLNPTGGSGTPLPGAEGSA